jgi:hypothetical protein
MLTNDLGVVGRTHDPTLLRADEFPERKCNGRRPDKRISPARNERAQEVHVLRMADEKGDSHSHPGYCWSDRRGPSFASLVCPEGHGVLPSRTERASKARFEPRAVINGAHAVLRLYKKGRHRRGNRRAGLGGAAI